jgi:hypothetical protein
MSFYPTANSGALQANQRQVRIDARQRWTSDQVTSRLNASKDGGDYALYDR